MSKSQYPNDQRDEDIARPSCAPIEEGCMSLPSITQTNTSPKSGCDFEIGWNGARSRKSSRCSIKSTAPSISSTTTLPSIDRGKSQSVNSITASSSQNSSKCLERVELVRSPSCPELGYELDEPQLVKNGDLGASIHPSMLRSSKKPEGGQKGLFRLPNIFGKTDCAKPGALTNDTAQETPNIFVPKQTYKRGAGQTNENGNTKNPHNSLAPLDNTTTDTKKKSKRRHKRKNRRMNPENERDIPENVETLSLVSHGTPVGEIKFDGERFESAGTRVIERVAIENGTSQECNRSSTMSFTRSISKAEIAIHN